MDSLSDMNIEGSQTEYMDSMKEHIINPPYSSPDNSLDNPLDNPINGNIDKENKIETPKTNISNVTTESLHLLNKNISENNVKLQIENKEKFNTIIRNYKHVYNYLENIKQDIEKLKKIHTIYVTQSENKIRFHEYGIYIDDIFYQIKILKMEHKNMMEIYQNNLNKLYKDVFRLYRLIIKKLIEINIENNTNVDKNEKIITDKKQYYTKIKIFNEIENDDYTIEEAIILYDELINRLNDFYLCISKIEKNIREMRKKSLDGFLLQTYVISLSYEKNRIDIEYSMFHKILSSILEIHTNISRKYCKRAEQISNEVLDDNEKNVLLREYSVA